MAGFFYHRLLKKLKLKDKTQAKNSKKTQPLGATVLKFEKLKKKNLLAKFPGVPLLNNKYAIFITICFQ